MFFCKVCKGLVEKKKGMYDRAEELFSKALNLAQRVGEDNPKIGLYLCNLADVERKRSNFPASLNLYER